MWVLRVWMDHIGVCLPYIRLMFVVKPKYHNAYVRHMSATIFGACSPYVHRMFAVCPPYVCRMSAVCLPYVRRMTADHPPYNRRMSAICPPYVRRMSTVYPPYLIAHFPRHLIK